MILEVATDDHIHQLLLEVVITTATLSIHIETNDEAITIASPAIDPILLEKDTVHLEGIANDLQEGPEMVELRETQRLFLSRRA